MSTKFKILCSVFLITCWSTSSTAMEYSPESQELSTETEEQELQKLSQEANEHLRFLLTLQQFDDCVNQLARQFLALENFEEIDFDIDTDSIFILIEKIYNLCGDDYRKIPIHIINSFIEASEISFYTLNLHYNLLENAARRNANILSILLEITEFDKNFKNNKFYRQDLLILAIKAENLETIQTLLKPSKSILGARDINGLGPFTWAAYMNRDDIFKLLVSKAGIWAQPLLKQEYNKKLDKKIKTMFKKYMKPQKEFNITLGSSGLSTLLRYFSLLPIRP